MKRTLNNDIEKGFNKPCLNRDINIRRSQFSYTVVVVT